MERFIVQCIGFVLDWVPYTAGRVAIFLFTFDSLRCERWKPIVWETDLFGHPWWRKIDDEIVVTQWGARWAGWVLLVIVGIGLALLILRMILRM